MSNRTRGVSDGLKDQPPSGTSHQRPQRTLKGISTAISITVMLTGVAMVCQPFFHMLFRYGFLVTLAGIIAFTIASNLPERHG